MNDDVILNPAAIIRAVKRTREELESESVRLYAVYDRHGRKLLEAGRDLGEVLAELRDQCGAGEWYPLLEKLGIPRRTASRLVAKFKGHGEGSTGQLADTGDDLEENLAGHLGSSALEDWRASWREAGVEPYAATVPELVARLGEGFFGVPLEIADDDEGDSFLLKVLAESAARVTGCGRGRCCRRRPGGPPAPPARPCGTKATGSCASSFG
jgi:hypothetical protein